VSCDGISYGGGKNAVSRLRLPRSSKARLSDGITSVLTMSRPKRLCRASVGGPAGGALTPLVDRLMLQPRDGRSAVRAAGTNRGLPDRCELSTRFIANGHGADDVRRRAARFDVNTAEFADRVASTLEHVEFGAAALSVRRTSIEVR
jgi:hypothetical protein